MTAPQVYAVIGSSGMIGSHVLAHLADLPDTEVRALYHTHEPRVIADNITPIQADARDVPAMTPHLLGADRVLIAAGILATTPVLQNDPVNPVVDHLAIVTGALKAAYDAECPNCVCLSSGTGYPDMDGSISEDRMFESDPAGTWFGLGWATRLIEKQCQWYAEKLPRQMPVIVLRPALVYGEYDHFDELKAHFLPSLIRRVVAREAPITVWGDGEQKRDLIYAGDLVDAIMAAFEYGGPYDAFNAATGVTHSVNECLSQIISLDEFSDAKIHHEIDRPGNVADRRFDTTKAARDLGFTSRTSLKEGLQRTISWYRQSLPC